jgi:hypothetical protein
MTEEIPWKHFMLFVKFGTESAPETLAYDNELGYYGTLRAVERLEDALVDIKDTHLAEGKCSDDQKMICYLLQSKLTGAIIHDVLVNHDKMRAFRKSQSVGTVPLFRDGDTLLIAELTGKPLVRNFHEAQVWYSLS